MEVLQDRYKDTKVGRIPKDWEVMMLNEITNYKSSNLSLNKLEENTGKYKLYGASGMLKGIDFYQTDKESFAIVKDGSGFGNLLWCDKNSSILGTLGRITNKEILDLKFCFYLTHTIKFKRYMSGSTIPHLYYKDYGNIKLPVPPLPEQRKIAAILSTVDELISTTDKIIEKSKELKKGLMQKLFSEGIGHTEFKDTKVGRIPKDWEVKSLEEVGLIKVGRDLNKEIYNPTLSKEHKVRVYSNAITDRGLYGFYSRSEYPKNSITITGRGDIGYAFARNEEFGAIGRLIVIHPNSNVDYIYLTNYINHSVNFHIETSGIPQLTGVQASKYKVAIPPLPEQQKIAAILSEADAKIEKEQIQKAQLQALKKGLMQQLLTGKKRVNV